MNKPLEIRAAKVLKWRCLDIKQGWFTDFGPNEVHLIGASMKGIINVTSMRFTTSYDWSTLGIKECCRRKLLDELQDALCDQLEDHQKYIFELRVDQITQAWVGLLEALND